MKLTSIYFVLVTTRLAAQPLVINPKTIPDGALGKPYSVTFTPNEEVKKETWVFTPPAGGLPGLTFTPGDSRATLSGTPTQGGLFIFNIQALHDCPLPPRQGAESVLPRRTIPSMSPVS